MKDIYTLRNNIILKVRDLSPDMLTDVSNYLQKLERDLQARRDKIKKQLNSESDEDLFADLYHYLQHASKKRKSLPL